MVLICLLGMAFAFIPEAKKTEKSLMEKYIEIGDPELPFGEFYHAQIAMEERQTYSYEFQECEYDLTHEEFLDMRRANFIALYNNNTHWVAPDVYSSRYYGNYFIDKGIEWFPLQNDRVCVGNMTLSGVIEGSPAYQCWRNTNTSISDADCHDWFVNGTDDTFFDNKRGRHYANPIVRQIYIGVEVNEMSKLVYAQSQIEMNLSGLFDEIRNSGDVQHLTFGDHGYGDTP